MSHEGIMPPRLFLYRILCSAKDYMMMTFDHRAFLHDKVVRTYYNITINGESPVNAFLKAADIKIVLVIMIG